MDWTNHKLLQLIISVNDISWFYASAIIEQYSCSSMYAFAPLQ